MKVQTEITLRGVLEMDGSVAKADVDRAINILNGRVESENDLVHVIRRKDVMRMLGIHRRTLDYYIDRGYLDRVYGGGERAIGVSRESFIRFTTRRREPLVRKPKRCVQH